MRRQKFMRSLVQLFPESYRITRGHELRDALDDQPVHGWRIASESIALISAAALAWLRFLRTPTGIRNSAFIGALAWLGVIIAYGPVGRIQAFQEGNLYGFYDANDYTFAIIAAGLLVIAFSVSVRWRLLAGLVGAVGVVFSALSLRVGDWQLASALFYEARWIGAVLAAALALRGTRRVSWPALVIASLPGMLLAFSPLGKSGRGNGYYGLTRINETRSVSQAQPATGTGRTFDAPPLLESYQVHTVLSSGLLQWLLIAALLFFVLGPWFVPAIAGLALPAVVHASLLDPFPAALIYPTYLAAAAWIRVRIMPEHPWTHLRSRGRGELTERSS